MVSFDVVVDVRLTMASLVAASMLTIACGWFTRPPTMTRQQLDAAIKIQRRVRGWLARRKAQKLQAWGTSTRTRGEARDGEYSDTRTFDDLVQKWYFLWYIVPIFILTLSVPLRYISASQVVFKENLVSLLASCKRSWSHEKL